MRLGLLTDIHESLQNLEVALRILKQLEVDKIVVIGDVVETGSNLQKVTERLAESQAIGVWGNHDFGISFQPDADVVARYSKEVIGFMTGLHPRLEIENCLFTHVEPWLDATDLSQLWYFDGVPATVDAAAKSFGCTHQRFLFVGHFHCWRIITDQSVLPWSGEQDIDLSPYQRALVSVGALCDGGFAVFDTSTCVLSPRHINA